MAKKLDLSQILDAIKTDNVNQLYLLASSDLNISFGRFPILTLCYLYDAKKIIKKYKSILLNITAYKIVDEPIQVYFDFKKCAEKCLRLYANHSEIISYIEILAIKGKDYLVKKQLKNLNNCNQVIEKLKRIYLIKGQNFKYENNKVSIEKPLLNHKKTKSLKVKLATVSSLLISCMLVFTLCFTLLGFSTKLTTAKITNNSQYEIAIKTNNSFVLSNYFQMENIPANLTNSCNLDFNNNTIYVNEISQPLFEKNYGVIKNLNIVYLIENENIESNLNLLTNENFGTIENVNVTAKFVNLNINREVNDVFICGISNINSGIIKNCNVKLNADTKVAGNKEGGISGFVYLNNGEISNCTLINNSHINAIDTDLCGIALTNSENAKIVNCSNFANLFQQSQNDGWSPNVAGICLTNYGQINHCINSGNIQVISTNNKQNSTSSVFAGGITSFNHNLITKCLNKGNITAKSNSLIIYCGGISAYTYASNNISAKIENCGVNSTICVESVENTAFVFAGGIGGYTYGEIKNCYSQCTFEKEDLQKYFTGTVIGSTAFQPSFATNYIFVTLDNISVLGQENARNIIASLVFNNTIYQGIESFENVSVLTTSEQLTSQGVYWYE